VNIRKTSKEGLTCRDVVGLLADFLELTLTEQRIVELEEHLAGCEPCRAYLNTYRRTRELTGRTEHAEMPEEMRTRLRDFLVRQLFSAKR
jgi:predicted anti-sigma-YlaC factor YlaD